MNTPKLQLHIEQLFLRTTWRLAERLFYNEGRKEKVQWDRRGREAIWLDPTALVGDPEEEDEVASLGSLLKEQGFQPHVGHLSPGVQRQEVAPPWLVLETSRAYQRLQETKTLLLQHAPRVACCWSQHRGIRLKSGWCSGPPYWDDYSMPPSLLGALAANAPQERTYSSRWTAAHTPPASAPPPPLELTSSTPRSSHGSYLILGVATTPDSNPPSPKWQSQHILEKAWPKNPRKKTLMK